MKAVGVDTASLDHGQSKDVKVHTIFCEANIPGFVMVANLDKLPASGATLYAAPMKIKDGPEDLQEYLLIFTSRNHAQLIARILHGST